MFVSPLPHPSTTETRIKEDTSRTLFNSTMALVLIILSLPLLIIISSMILVRSGRPIIYRGKRLGLRKKPFTMYKFRTLNVGAEQVIGPKLLSESQMLCLSQDLVTPVGKFLRDTRLDELPQLFNVLKGDMVFVGPRPERQAVYERTCRHISRYEERFQVKPGLIGYAQLFTPHCTPKRMRSLIDNRFLKMKPNLGTDIFIIIYTTTLVIAATLKKMTKLCLGAFGTKTLGSVNQEDRQYEFARIKDGNAIFDSGDEQNVHRREAILLGINEKNLYIQLDNPVATLPSTHVFKLVAQFTHKGGMKKTKTARCEGKIHRVIQEGKKYLYEVKYKPISSLDDYVLQQYFLKKSIAPFYQARDVWRSLINDNITTVASRFGNKRLQWATQSTLTNNLSKNQG